MGRTDRRGRDLKTFLQAEIERRDMDIITDLWVACGITKGIWYADSRRPERVPRRDAEDFPNREELGHVADYYKLGDKGYLNLLVEFGWIKPTRDTPGFTQTPRYSLRQDRPPL